MARHVHMSQYAVVELGIDTAENVEFKQLSHAKFVASMFTWIHIFYTLVSIRNSSSTVIMSTLGNGCADFAIQTAVQTGWTGHRPNRFDRSGLERFVPVRSRPSDQPRPWQH